VSRESKQERQEARAAQRKAARFLEELNELTKRHGIKIGGCGDCGSPWVVPATKKYSGPNLVDHLHYCDKHQAYGPYAGHTDC
jgi:hypothetical protein